MKRRILIRNQAMTCKKNYYILVSILKTPGKYLEKSLRKKSKSFVHCETKENHTFLLQERMPIVPLLVSSYMMQIAL